MPAYERDKILTIQKIQQEYYKVYGRTIDDWKLRREIIPMLCTAGKIRLEQNPADKRNNLIIPVLSTPDSIISDESNIDTGVE